MEDIYGIIVTPMAESDLWHIRQYIAIELQNPSAALRILSMLEKAISSLVQFPQRVVCVEQEPWHTKKVRRMVAEKFLIYFWIDEVSRQVFIVKVIYGSFKELPHLTDSDF